MTRRLALAALLACSSPSATIAVTTGGESPDDVLKGVTSIELDAVDQTGTSTKLQTATLPAASTIDLGDHSQTLVASLQLTGKDAAGDAVVFGATPLVELGALSGGTLSLFVQRKGEVARMPGATEDGRASPLLAATDRAIYWAGGTLSGTPGPLDLGGYDLLGLDAFTTTCQVSLDPTSFALVELTTANVNGDVGYVALVSDAGFLAVGLPSCGGGADTPTATVPNTLPLLPSWSAVAGAATVMGDDGTAYIVGPSKLDAASSSILVLSPTATAVTEIDVGTARQGAAVAWAPGRGVFVYGGGGGAMTISAGGAPVNFDYASDPAQGLAAVAFDGTTTMLVLEAGVRDATHRDHLYTLDLTRNCGGTPCRPTPWGAPFPVALRHSSLFAMGNHVFVAVGDDASGATHLVRADATTSVDVPLKFPRHGARAIQTTRGAVVIVGGGSSTPESYVD